MRDDPLSPFHPGIRAWFREEVGNPTDVQARSWPLIAQGRHVLLTAPTGSGKTLTAFLWALNRFAAGTLEPGTTRILYVSPLKALNNDIRRNLLAPLERLRARFAASGEGGIPFPDIQVAVRSGDTPPSERRRLLRRPPEILITTPESLNLLLLTGNGRASLTGLSAVILDEIHAVAGTKRGVHLITAVDRLVPLAGEFQRIALSATVRPLPLVAAWVAGFRREGAEYVPREMDIVESKARKEYRLQVSYPAAEGEDGRPGPTQGASAAAGTAAGRAGVPENPPPEVGPWEKAALALKGIISRNRSTLIFANNRRLSERLARLLNEGEAKPLAYSHHGSLSREIRSEVEARMKEGRLPAIVATSSLEMGIDIGSLDHVVLVETPPSISTGLQRLGRAGHGVGQASHGSLFASHGRDLLDAAVAVPCMESGDIEAVRPLENPLDLLAQVLLAMAVAGEGDLDALYARIRASYPYRNLARRPFDLVVDMLAGRYAESRIPELKPRLAVDAVDRSVRALKGAPLLLGLSGGTIPDRGYYALRLSGSRAKIGELDEEFVWERREGELFALGAQSWRIVSIGANDVEVVPAERAALMAPFWRAEERDRDVHFSLRLAEFLEEADSRLEEPDFARELGELRRLDPPAAGALLAYLRRQKAETRSSLPHRHHLLVEDCGEAPGAEAPGRGGRQIVLHAPWGGKLTRPWGHALAAAWEDLHGLPLDMAQDDDALLVRLPPGESPLRLLELVHSGNLEGLLRRRLERTGFFAAHFRENAARALLLPRSSPRSRVPLWLNRQRSRKLLGAVMGYGDFPLVLETWRECLQDEFALDALKARLEEVQSGAIALRETRTPRPSPFAEGLMWKQTNQFMYERDSAPGPAGRGTASTRPDLLREIAFSAPLRPRLPKEVVDEFESKARRLAPGYGPQGAREWVEWAKERVLIPWEEWIAARPAGPDPDGADLDMEYPAGYLASRLVRVTLPGASAPALAAVESLPRLLAALEMRKEDLALGSPWGGASPEAQAAKGFGVPAEALEALDRLLAASAASAADEDPEFSGDEPSGASDPLDALLLQWLRAYGPLPPEALRAAFGNPAWPRLEEALGRLAEGELLVADTLTEGADGTEVCTAANLETLLRLLRRRARPTLQSLPAARLPLFAAAWQGLAAPARDVEGVQAALERLFGLPAPAAAWEADILPARVMPYQTAWIDALFRDSDLLWFGAGRERMAFAFPEDLELYRPAPEGPALEASAGVAAGPEDGAAAGAATQGNSPVTPEARQQVLDLLRAAAPGRLDFPALAARSPLPSSTLAAVLWDLAWDGRITNDTYAALRRGAENGFREAQVPAAPAASRRGSFQRWKAARPLSGSWLALEAPEEADPLEREELAKDRARQLLRRYGVIFREQLAQEMPALQWGKVFRALRLLELSGEVLTGRFFEGVPGVQFLSPSALPLLEGGLPDDAVYWMSAQDPASPAGLGLEGLPYALPPRASGTHLVFHGAELVLVSRRQGRDLTVRVPPRHRYLGGYLGSLRQLVERSFLPQKAVEVETVNGVGAATCPYLEDFQDAGFEKGIKSLSLRRRF